MNIAQRCLHTADHTDAIVFVDASGHPGTRLSRADLANAVEARAAALHTTGVCRGDTVALTANSDARSVVDLLAILYLGAVAAPLSPQLVERELLDAIARTEASRVLTGAATSRAPHRAVSPAVLDRDDPAWIVMTSGTTGTPRAVVHAMRVVEARDVMNRAWGEIGPGDRVLHTGRLNWTYAFGVGLLDTLAAGATAILLENPARAEALPTIVRDSGATLLATVPGMVRPLLRLPDESLAALRGLRHAMVAGEQLAPRLLETWTDRVGIELREALGMSECSTYVSSGPFAPPRAGWAGRQQPGRGEVVVLKLERDGSPAAHGEIGLLAVHASDAGLMLGYRDAPLAQTGMLVGAYFVGGDLAVASPDGYLRWCGRGDDLLNNLGYRVSAIEIEAVLAVTPGVHEVAVVEVPRADGVGILTAFVSFEHASESGSMPRLLELAEHQLADFKRPRAWVEVDALPRTPAGKVDRAALRRSDR
jgi:acyl-coenzyme A synthetase/AMP-(fatty) acid ligase